MPPDRAEAIPTILIGNFEGIYLDNYRRPKDTPHANPWYYHGLFKLAPGKHWDDGTGPDYAFGKVAGNYRAYVGAMRAVMTMRYLLGGIAAGKSVDDLVQQAHEGTGAELCDPPGAARAAGIGLGQAKAFLTGYITDFHGQLQVLTLDLQKFEDKAWTAGGISITDRVAWDKRMGWWGGPGAGGGTGPDNSRDYFITGLRLSGQGLRDGRPQFNPFDFLFNHLPSLTPSQEKAQDTLARMAEDAFWDPLLPEVKGPAGANSVRDAAHALLGKLRQELQTDYLFARKYGFVLFQGDKFGRSPTVMEE